MKVYCYCVTSVNDFRKFSEQLRLKNSQEHTTVKQLQTQITDTLLLQYPDQHIQWITHLLLQRY